MSDLSLALSDPFLVISEVKIGPSDVGVRILPRCKNCC